MARAERREPVFILDTSAAGVGDWFPFNSGAWYEGKDYTLSFEITPGDSIRIEVTNDVSAGAPTGNMITSSAEHDSTVTGDTIAGTWKFIRAVKTGTNGPAKVLAVI